VLVEPANQEVGRRKVRNKIAFTFLCHLTKKTSLELILITAFTAHKIAVNNITTNATIY
jgi:hypothetical protein